jgi:hypothetical protein
MTPKVSIIANARHIDQTRVYDVILTHQHRKIFKGMAILCLTTLTILLLSSFMLYLIKLNPVGGIR